MEFQHYDFNSRIRRIVSEYRHLEAEELHFAQIFLTKARQLNVVLDQLAARIDNRDYSEWMVEAMDLRREAHSLRERGVNLRNRMTVLRREFHRMLFEVALRDHYYF